MLNILVADDEAPIREWLVFSLEKFPEKYRVTGAARSGAHALELMQAERPDLVITDIKMPGLTGLELMKTARELYPDVRFVILTNFADFTYAREAVTGGAFDYLLKADIQGKDLYRVLDRFEQARHAGDTPAPEKPEERYADLDSLFALRGDTQKTAAFWAALGQRDGDETRVMLLDARAADVPLRQLAALAGAAGAQPGTCAAGSTGVCMAVRMDTDTAKLLALQILRTFGVSVGVGLAVWNSGESFASLDTARLALEHTFLVSQPGAWLYDELEAAGGGNSEELHEVFQQVMGAVQHAEYWQASQKLPALRTALAHLHVRHALRGRAACIKLMQAVETRYLEGVGRGGEAPRGELPGTVRECLDTVHAWLDHLALSSVSDQSEPVMRAMEVIRGRYMENLSLSGVARGVYLSPEYFSRLFKEVTGENFSSYLMTYRLNKARELLRTTDRKVSQVAADVGYANHSYFSKIYKQYLGRTPDQERREGAPAG